MSHQQGGRGGGGGGRGGRGRGDGNFDRGGGGRGGRGSDRGGGGGRGGGQRGGYDGGRGGGGYDGGRGGGRGGGGDFNRGRGYDRGRGGSRGPPIMYIPPTEMPPGISEKIFPKLTELYGVGWKKFDGKLQQYKGDPATSFKEKIKVKVNHFPLSKFQVPEKVFHYEVKMERMKFEGASTDKKPQKAQKSPKKGGGGSEAAPGGPDNVKKPPRPIPQLILQYLIGKINKEKNFYGIVSDLSNNIYSTQPLENLKIDLIQEVPVSALDNRILQEDEKDPGKYKVTIARSELDVPTEALKALNAHLRAHGTWHGLEMDVSVKTVLEQIYNAVVKSFPSYAFLPLGRSNLMRWPSSDQETFSLGNGATCWKGISAHITLGWKAFLNVDLSHCAFLEDQKVPSALSAHFTRGYNKFDASKRVNLRGGQLDEARRLLKNVKVTYMAGRRGKMSGPITDILNTPVGQTTFDLNGKRTSVSEYFQKEYGIRVNPEGICLQLRKRAQVPAELCTIKKGQSYNRKLNDIQTSNMLKAAKKDPRDLHREIVEQVGQLLLAGPTAKEWGVSVEKNMITFNDTRVLNAPKLIYGNGTGVNKEKFATITPSDGTWDVFSAEFNFLGPKRVMKWGILAAGDCREGDERNLRNLEEMLRRSGQSKGVLFHPEFPAILDYAYELRDVKDDPNTTRTNVGVLTKRFQAFLAEKCEIVFVVIPKKNSSIYSHVKQAAEIHVGILTQCVVSANVGKGQAATINNILLKVNSKLGGKNYMVRPPIPDPRYLDIVMCPMLIIGADVTHPPPGSTRRVRIGQKEVEVAVPSFAAVTGSVDRTGMPFMMDVRAQVKAGRGAAEVIQNFDDIVHKMLLKFEQTTKGPNTPNGIRPRKIIYYRDGVGEGQFPEILNSELTDIHKACNRLKDWDGAPYEPKITFVTVQKRHKTRFFYEHPNQGIINAPAGTVVDREIVHQTENDFFLLSHKGMMGTSRPTRYHVLWDDSDFSADQIQNLTYYLCYMYIRCTKSVRIPAPTYYAHWAAARAKALAEGMDEFYGDVADLNQRIQRHANITGRFPMHFV